ncbi:MAG: hypothetical protein NTW96_24980 [Planctomycetia bacterium]|nr:hypothetical protein [Planctomycetia bacterium]
MRYLIFAAIAVALIAQLLRPLALLPRHYRSVMEQTPFPKGTTP